MSPATGEQPHCQGCGSPGVLHRFSPLDLCLCITCYLRALRAESRAARQFDDYDLDAIELDLDDFDDLDDLKAALKAAFKRAHEKEAAAARRAQAARRARRDGLKMYVVLVAAPLLIVMLAGWLVGRTTLMDAVGAWLSFQMVVGVGVAWIAYRDWRRRR
jgi:hypothetical protein